jgi:hypothetical protein
MHSDASTKDSQPKPPPVADPIPPAGHRSFDIDGELRRVSWGGLGRTPPGPDRSHRVQMKGLMRPPGLVDGEFLLPYVPAISGACKGH